MWQTIHSPLVQPEPPTTVQVQPGHTPGRWPLWSNGHGSFGTLMHQWHQALPENELYRTTPRQKCNPEGISVFIIWQHDGQNEGEGVIEWSGKRALPRHCQQDQWPEQAVCVGGARLSQSHCFLLTSCSSNMQSASQGTTCSDNCI